MIEKKNGKKDVSEPAVPFETVTLAEIFIQQGYLGKGLEIYRKLYRLDPRNLEFEKRVIDLTSRMEVEGPVAEGADRVRQGSPPAQETTHEIDGVAREDRIRVLETLNKWLIAVRKRKKHVQ